MRSAARRPRSATSASCPNAELFARIGSLRKALYLEPRFHDAIRDVIAASASIRRASRSIRSASAWSCTAATTTRSPRRSTTRTATPGTRTRRRSSRGGSRSTICRRTRRSCSIPSGSRAPVDNDSEIFDYGDWVRDGWELKIGWQKLGGRTPRYPRAAPGVDGGRAVGFACRTGDNLVFSGAHFHATLPQATGRTRFSLDFRIVDLDDHAAGLGAPNVDNRSRGSALATTSASAR